MLTPLSTGLWSVRDALVKPSSTDFACHERLRKAAKRQAVYESLVSDNPVVPESFSNSDIPLAQAIRDAVGKVVRGGDK